MKGRCPFCWDRNVSRVGESAAGPNSARASTWLMECDHCEKWFWADSGEEVPRLFEVCSTAWIAPFQCFDEIRNLLYGEEKAFPRWRAAEFNTICGDCQNARFVQRRMAARV